MGATLKIDGWGSTKPGLGFLGKEVHPNEA
jgi:hypothetical protein